MDEQLESNEGVIRAWIEGYVLGKTAMGALTPRVLVGLCGAASLELGKVFGLRVVPGWAVFSDDPADRAEHVWCESAQGKVYDPTALQFQRPPVRYVAWKPGDTVRVGKCMNCGEEIFAAVDSLDDPTGYRSSCSRECDQELDACFNG